MSARGPTAERPTNGPTTPARGSQPGTHQCSPTCGTPFPALRRRRSTSTPAAVTTVTSATAASIGLVEDTLGWNTYGQLSTTPSAAPHTQPGTKPVGIGLGLGLRRHTQSPREG